MITKRFMHAIDLCAIAIATTLVATAVVSSRADEAGLAIDIGDSDLGGVVTGPSGPEAGVWVIAETSDLATKFAKVVVTDERGRYVVPDLPMSRPISPSTPPRTSGLWRRSMAVQPSPVDDSIWGQSMAVGFSGMDQPGYIIRDPKSGKWSLIDTCFTTHHLYFAHDADNTLWTSAGGPQSGVVGWLNTRKYEETGDEATSQGWTPIILDTNGNDKRDGAARVGHALELRSRELIERPAFRTELAGHRFRAVKRALALFPRPTTACGCAVTGSSIRRKFRARPAIS